MVPKERVNSQKSEEPSLTFDKWAALIILSIFAISGTELALDHGLDWYDAPEWLDASAIIGLSASTLSMAAWSGSAEEND